MWAPQPIFMPPQIPGMDALSAFCTLYDPAIEESTSDYFTTREIQSIIFNHTGIHMELMEIHQLLSEMKYSYKLDDHEFRWMVKKC